MNNRGFLRDLEFTLSYQSLDYQGQTVIKRMTNVKMNVRHVSHFCDSYSCSTRIPASTMGGLPAWGRKGPSVQLPAWPTLGMVGPDLGEGGKERGGAVPGIDQPLKEVFVKCRFKDIMLLKFVLTMWTSLIDKNLWLQLWTGVCLGCSSEG